MTVRRIPDVSNYQGVPNFSAMKAADPTLSGVIIKASEGAWGFTNQYLDAQYQSALDAKLAVGFYTFWHPDIAGTTDAQIFLSRISGYQAELGLWLDAEVSDGVPASIMLGRMLEDLNYIAQKYPLKTGVYTAPWWFDPNTIGAAQAHMENWPLWLAGYTAQLPPSPAPWKSPLLWQYNDVYQGQSMDISLFLGSDAQWEWMTTGHVPGPPKPVPFPQKIQILQRVTHHGSVDGIFDFDLDRRCMGIRAMSYVGAGNNPAANRADKAQVRYAQQVMAFPPVQTDGIWLAGGVTHTHVIATIKAIQGGLGCPQTGTWDAATEFSWMALNPYRPEKVSANAHI